MRLFTLAAIAALAAVAPRPAAAQDLIIDNVDPGFSVVQGTWSTGTSATNKYGADYRFITSAVGSGGPPSARVEWRPTITTPGSYEVSVWYNHAATAPNNRPVDARYTVHHPGGSQTFVINQEINGGQWTVLGTFALNAGTAARVDLTDQCELGQAVIADAARFRHTGGPPPPPGTPEVRGVWCSRFQWASDSPATAQGNISATMANAQSGNFNCVFFQVRGQCDTLYPSPHEPWSPLVTSPDGVHPGWDPMQFAITQAHSRGLQLHAYFNTHTIWGSATPPSYAPTHVYWQHGDPNNPAARDWLLHDSTGSPAPFNEYHYMNPGIPDADAHVRREAMHLVSTYDIDGLHFDRVRMTTAGYGRNPIAVARWDDAATPAPNDGPGNPDQLGWDDFMRDCITRAVVNMCGEAWSIDPDVLLSSAPLGLRVQSDYPGYPSGFFYGYPRGQDAAAWMVLGAQDFVVPQIYWADGGALPDFSSVYPPWQALAGAAGRACVPGSNMSNGQAEVENHALIARAGGAAGHNIWHSGSTNYANWVSAGQPYAQPAAFPTFPWRQTESVIVGRVYRGDGTTPVTDAWITRNGSSWTALSSGDGFYCFLRVPPGGGHTISATHPAYGTAQVTNVSTTAGLATTVDIVLPWVPAEVTQFGQN